MNEFIDIKNRKEDYEDLHKDTFRIELGLRAISFMYDDHSDDKNSYEKILSLKENIHYRLFSATHQYLVFLRELGNAENYLQKLYQENPNYISAFPLGNPYFEKVEQELSSIFDNIIFQMSSVFDYMSHVICYMMFKNKSKTVYWTKLAKTARGSNNELENKDIKTVIDNVDRRFVGKLYDYRSRLLHNKRDKHQFGGEARLTDFAFDIKISPSNIALKHFKLVQSELNEDKKITLTFLSSWIIKRSFFELEELMNGLEIELKKNSHFHKNLRKPKRSKGFMFAYHNSETNFAEPVSEALWKQFKNKNTGNQ